HIDHSRRTYNLLRLDVERLVHGGRLAEGPDRVLAILNISSGMREDPFLISLLVQIAGRATAVYQIERLLGMGELPEQSCRKLMDAITARRKENLLLAGGSP